ncbi:hypothetical protein A3731_06245 [Roseovarius sp. HI0049]|nr:hypothetical protein A3731_06245 [Roseovarius sp. HI0049]
MSDCLTSDLRAQASVGGGIDGNTPQNTFGAETAHCLHGCRPEPHAAMGCITTKTPACSRNPGTRQGGYPVYADAVILMGKSPRAGTLQTKSLVMAEAQYDRK